MECHYCNKIFIRLATHLNACPSKKRYELVEKTKLEAERDLLLKIGTGTTINNITVTNNVICIDDAKQEFTTKFKNVVKHLKPFIRQYANDLTLMDKVIEYGKQSGNDDLKNFVINVMEDNKPLEQITDISIFQDPNKVKDAYEQAKLECQKELNTIVEIERLPEYDDDIDKLDRLLML